MFASSPVLITTASFRISTITTTRLRCCLAVKKLADAIREEDAVNLVLEPGDVSLHHTLAVHSSRTNRSDDWRIGVGISYIPASVRHIGRPGCPQHWRAAPTASVISITKPRPRPNSMLPHLVCMPTRSRAIGKRRPE